MHKRNAGILAGYLVPGSEDSSADRTEKAVQWRLLRYVNSPLMVWYYDEFLQSTGQIIRPNSTQSLVMNNTV